MMLLEWKRVIRDSGVIVLVLFLLFAALLATDRDAYITPALEIFLLLYSSFMGWSIFERERHEGALEFFLGIPLGKYKLLFLKCIPRVAAALFILFYYWALQEWFAFPFVLDGAQFTIAYGALFFVSFSFSLLINSFLGSFFLSASLFAGLSYFIKYLEYSLTNTDAMKQSGLWLLVLPIVFIAMYRFLDIKPISFFHKKLAPVMLLAVILVFGANYLFTGSEWWNFYLTGDNYLLKTTKDKTVLEKEGAEPKTLPGRMVPLLETGNILLAARNENDRRYAGELVRLDIISGNVEVLYSADPGWWFHEGPTGKLGTHKDGRYYFLLTDKNHLRYKVVVVHEDVVDVIPVNYNFKQTEQLHRVYHALEDPLQIFLFSGTSLYRVNESGDTERLWEAEDVEAWNDRILIFGDGPAILYQINGGLPREIMEIDGPVRKIRCRFDRCGHRKVLYKIENKAYMLDLETQVTEPIDLRSTPYYYLDTPEGVRVVWVAGSEITVAEYKNGRMTIESVWYTQLEGFRLFQVYPSGIIVFNRNEHEIFKFIDNSKDERESLESAIID